MTTLIRKILTKVQKIQRIAVDKGLTANFSCAPTYMSMYFHDWSRAEEEEDKLPKTISFGLYLPEKEDECKKFLDDMTDFVSKWSPKMEA